MFKKIVLFYSILIFTTIHGTNVLLKSGGVIKGKVISQDADQMILVDEKGITRNIPKSNILKTVYKEYSDQELVAIRKEEERKLNLEKQNKQVKNQKDSTEIKKNNNLALRQFVLSSNEENCVLFGSKTEWFWFYGNFPITNPDAWIELLPQEDIPVRVIYKSTWIDSTFTLIVGSLTSISRKTKQIEVCEF